MTAPSPACRSPPRAPSRTRDCCPSSFPASSSRSRHASSQPPGTGASSSWTSRTARRSTTSTRSRRSIVREWREDGKLAGLTLLLGRFARGAFAQRADRIPLLREKEEWLLAHSGARPASHRWREIRAAFNQFPKAELFYADAAELKPVIDRVVDVASDDELLVSKRTGAGYEALYVGFSRLHYSYEGEQALAPRAGRRLRAGGVRHVLPVRARDALPLLLRRPAARAAAGSSTRRAASPRRSRPTGRTRRRLPWPGRSASVGVARCSGAS